MEEPFVIYIDGKACWLYPEEELPEWDYETEDLCMYDKNIM